jgi:hypothetical protein
MIVLFLLFCVLGRQVAPGLVSFYYINIKKVQSK